MNQIVWGQWFGSYATIGAAKRYLTMQWTGAKYADEYWTGIVRQNAEGSWEVCLGQPEISEERMIAQSNNLKSQLEELMK